MTIRITPLRSDFAARIGGVDLVHGMSASVFEALRDALDRHSVLIVPDQPMNDEEQIAFSNWWGPMEPTKGVNPASGTPFARQSNLDIKSGHIIAPDDRRMHYQKGNYQWHADSTFKRVPSLCSILTAREVPPEGGNTEFVSTRGAYEMLPEVLKSRIENLVVEHDFSVSRARVGFAFTPEEAVHYPPVWHPLVQVNPSTGHRSLLIGAHASRIVGWPDSDGQALLDDLLARATVPDAIHSHRWRQGDVVIWDNRAALHRATAYDSARYRRLMQRTTIGNPGIMDTPAYRRIDQLRAAGQPEPVRDRG